MDELVVAWSRALNLLAQEKINEAYNLILSKEDDLYLIRLMTKTGVCYDRLQPEVSKELKRRAQSIGNNDYIQNLVSEFTGLKGNRRIETGDQLDATITNPVHEKEGFLRIEDNSNVFGQKSSLKYSQTNPSQGSNNNSWAWRQADKQEREKREELERLNQEAREVYKQLRNQLST